MFSCWFLQFWNAETEEDKKDFWKNINPEAVAESEVRS